MVKTVKFLALSLLMPSLALAMAPTSRDAAHFVAGALEAVAQDYCGHKAEGLQFADASNGAKPSILDHAVVAAKGYAGQSSLAAIAVGRIHNEVVGKYINAQVFGQDAKVTLRDNNARTLGNLLFHLKNNGWKPSSSVAFKSIDPFYAVAAAQWLWANKTSLWSTAQADAAALAASYNSGNSSTKAKAKK